MTIHTKDRFKLIPAVYLVLMKEGKVFLCRRKNTGYMDGYYSFPGGHLEGNEPATLAAVREAREELGLDILPQDLEFIHLLHRNMNQERMDVYFKPKDNLNLKPVNAEPDKCDDMQWFPVNQLPENTIGFIKSAIEHIEKKKMYSEYWDCEH